MSNSSITADVVPNLKKLNCFIAVLFPPPPPDDSANDKVPEPSVCNTCPLLPSEDGKVKPDTVKVPVVVRFSLPKLIAPDESVIDPFAKVKLPAVAPDGRVALVLA
tara:strand:- start:5471 stop:5788 length:318 start_codon:yes stop_codon:yes gene_type:complete